MERLLITNQQYLEFRKYYSEDQKDGEHIFRCKIRAELPYDFVRKTFSSGQQLTEPLTQGELLLEIKILKEIPNSPIRATGMMKLKTPEGNHFLKEIWEAYSGNVFLNWHMTGFGDLCIPLNGKYGPSSWQAEGVEVNRAMEIKENANRVYVFPRVYQAMKEIDVNAVMPAMINLWRRTETLRGYISVFLDLKKSPYQIAIEDEHLSKMQRLLENGIDTDLTLVTQDGNAPPVKCHRVILSMGSGKLENLLKMKEESTLDIMKNHSAECVEAFVAFLYHFDTTKVFESADIALDVLDAALEFQVVELISRIYNFINAKPNDEILACQAVKFFGIVKAHELKFKNDGEWKEDDGSGDDFPDDCSGYGYKFPDSGDESDDNEPVEPDFGLLGNENCREKRNAESDEVLNVKRLCYRFGDGLRGNPTNPTSPTGTNDSSDSDRDGTTSDSGSTNDETMDDSNHGIYKNYLDLLEIRAVTLIEWFLVKNRLVSIMDAVQGNRLVRRSKIRQALSNVIYQYCEHS